MRNAVLVLIAGIAGFGVWAWWRTSTPRVVPSSGGVAAPAAPAPATDVVVESGDDPGVAWRRPPRWTELPPRPVRLATYGVPAAAGDPEDASCAVFYFGPGQGGDAAANVDRWIGEFENPSAPRRGTRTVTGLNVTTVLVRGTHAAHADMSGGAAVAVPDFALFGAIVEGPAGMVFFKLTGPARTVAAAEMEFEALLGSLRVHATARP